MTIPESRCDTLQLFATGICPEGHQDDQRTDYVWLEDSNGSTPFERPSPITFELADFADSSRRTFGDYSSNPSNGRLRERQINIGGLELPYHPGSASVGGSASSIGHFNTLICKLYITGDALDSIIRNGPCTVHDHSCEGLS
ncbi:hypothetical protein POX_b02448 [Penicillium oxalicum]|uniref:hypothetical protein n=1 Tax=Penicillium oxalicum TaxID=69781 RepID=UPI0020B7C5E2|nr:hypothetical protein POX_b02448 [Penicillium oxalicum]KAI2792411.1 hypothetical protein POX_b02448 [Penicillium oxalicum]